MGIATTAAIIGLGGKIAGSVIGSKASNSAAKTLAEGAQSTIPLTQAAVRDAQAGIDTSTTQANAGLDESAAGFLELMRPYIESGKISLDQAMGLLGEGGALSKEFSFDRSNLDNDQGYNFAKEEGQKALERSAAVKGRLFSGAAAKEMARYSTGVADQYYGQAFDRAAKSFDMNRDSATTRFNGLLNLTGLGFNASNNAGTMGFNVAAQKGNNLTRGAEAKGNYGIRGSESIADALTGAASAKASGKMGSANAVQSGLQGFSDSVLDFIAMRNLEKWQPTPVGRAVV